MNPELSVSNLKLDVVLPLANRDYERFEILRKSLQRFFPDLGTCWVVVSDREYDQIRSKIRDSRYRLIAESTIIPELRFYDFLRVMLGRSHKPLGGWVTQQLRKLAIAQNINSQFYLTLDADVICTRLVRYSDLIRGDRALGDKAPLDIHRGWYERAAQVLRVPSVSGWHNLAPTLLSRDAVLMLQKHLASRVHPVLRALSPVLVRQSALNNVVVSWRSYLLRNLPWTEYALYYTFLEAMNLYDRYHVVDPDTVLEGNSVWKREEFASWDPRKSFCGRGKPNFFFAVVQSNLEIDAAQVWEKIRPYLEASEAPLRGPNPA